MSLISYVQGVVLALLLVLNAGAQTVASVPDGQPRDKTDLHVMTFNIRYGAANDGRNSWDNRKDLVFDVLRRNDPDVVGLQEALRSQIDDIRAALPEYGEIGVGRDDGKAKGEYSAILYRKDRLNLDDSGTFWLSDTPEVCGSITWGNACTRVCTWARFVRNGSGDAFYLFNTHMDHISQYSRERSAILLAMRLRDRAHPDPVIVTGDLNAGEENPAVCYLKGERPLDVAENGLSKNPIPLVDTFRVLHPDVNEVGTFHSFKGKPSGPKIDYIFTRPGVEVLQAGIVRDCKDDRYPSDHFPVTATLRFASPTGN